MFLVIHICNIIAVISFPLVKYCLDIILCINKYHLSRVVQMFIPKHFMGRENYFYLIFLHMGAASFIGGIVLIATVMMCVTYIKHACGMFRIAR